MDKKQLLNLAKNIFEMAFIINSRNQLFLKVLVNISLFVTCKIHSSEISLFGKREYGLSVCIGGLTGSYFLHAVNQIP